MTAPSSRLLPTGQLYTNGLDEATFNTTSGYTKNLFKYSETFNFDFTNWTLNGGFMTQNATLSPDGQTLAPKLIDYTTVGQNRIYNWHAVTQGTTYTYSIYLKPAERYIVRCYFEDTQVGGGGRVGAYLNLQTGTIITPYTTGTNTLLGSNLQNVGNGWYRFSWTVQAQLSAALNTTAFVIICMGIGDSTTQNFSYQGDGVSGMYIWGAQKEIGTVATIYEGTDGNGLPLRPNNLVSKIASTGLYVTGGIDEATYNPNSGYTKNLLKYSTMPANSIGGTYWVSYCSGGDYSNITTNTPDVVAPDGTYTAVKVVRNSATTCGTGTGWGFLTTATGILQANRTYTASVWVRSAAGSVPFSLGLNDYYNAYNAQSATPQWQRFTYTGTPNGAVNTLDRGIQFQTDQQNVTLYYWSPQLELGAVATDYEPTDANGLPLTPGMVQRVTNKGNHYVAGNYDEVSGILATTNGLVANFDTYIPGTFVTTSPTTWIDSTDSKYYGVYQNFQNQSKYNPTLGAFNFDNISNGTGNSGFNLTNQANSVTLDKFYTPTFSMEIWARTTSFNTNGPYNDILALWEYYQTTGFRCGIATPNGLSTDTTGRPAFWCDQSGGNFALNAGTYPINLNTWFQVLVTYDGSTCNLYFNGVLFNTRSIAIFKNPGKSAPFYIAGNNNGCQSFNGQMGIFRWYNRGLSAGEVADNFAGNRGRFGI